MNRLYTVWYILRKKKKFLERNPINKLFLKFRVWKTMQLL